jgi:hypothetical protein
MAARLTLSTISPRLQPLVFVRPNPQVPSATRDRFSFPTGRGGFRQKAALIIFLEAMRHLPTAATTAGEPSALSEGRVPRAPRFWASQGVAELHPPKLAEIYSAQSPVTGMVKTTGEGATPGLIAPKRE